MKNRVCDILGIEKPIVQAPMAWITSPDLVAAVSNAGGLGTLGFNGGFERIVSTPEDNADEIRKAIRKIKARTDKPFALNLTPSADDPIGFSTLMRKVALEEGVPVIVIAGTISEEDIRVLKDDGFKVIARQLNPSLEDAKRLERAGADIIVATGCDEGGCMPKADTGTMAITYLFADHLDVPVLAAGGVIDEKTARATKAVGAEGAFVGSRFILSDECPSDIRAKKNLMDTPTDQTVTFIQWNGLSKWRSTPTEVAVAGVKANAQGNFNPGPGNLRESMLLGELNKGVNSGSSIISMIDRIVPAKEIVDEISRGYED